MAICTALWEHMIDIAHFILDHHIQGYSSIQNYIRCNDIDQKFTWGADIEIFTLAHISETRILSYDVQTRAWWRFAPHNLERSLNDDIQQMSMYPLHTSDHFHVMHSKNCDALLTEKLGYIDASLNVCHGNNWECMLH